MADAGPSGGCGGRSVARTCVQPAPVELRDRACYGKDDVFSLCDTLARAEDVLIRVGAQEEARRVAEAFELLEAGLA
jgi:hypothetical protein